MMPSIVVAGGGIAGWMAAAGLAGALRGRFPITVVDTGGDTVDSVIATVPSLRAFHASLPIDEDDLIRATGATFRLGTLFSGLDPDGRAFFQPYGDFGQSIETVGFHHCWYCLRAMGDVPPLSAFALGAAAASLGRFQRPSTDVSSVLSSFGYGLHLDGPRYRDCLRGFALAHGVTLSSSPIRTVRRHDNGSIAALVLADGREVEGDLFIDMTDAGALSDGALNVGWEDWSRWLPPTRTATHTRAHDAPIPPYARMTVEREGWEWQVPLRDRMVVMRTGASNDWANGAVLRSGRRSILWDKNCVALGSAAGVLPPFQGTETLLIYTGLSRLLTLLPHGVPDPPGVAEYNRLTTAEWDHVRDFLILHRPGFTADAELPPHLRYKLDVFQSRARLAPYPGEIIPHASWVALFDGIGIVPRRHHPFADGIAAGELRRRVATLHSVIQQAANTMPSHETYLAGVAQ